MDPIETGAISSNAPWVTAKSTTGFTINFASAFSGYVDWILEQ